MNASTEPQPAMICKICGKKFESRKSYLRHGTYCRKAKSRVKCRKKACSTCTKAKARCDLAYPNCSRCLAKNLNCSFGLPSEDGISPEDLPAAASSYQLMPLSTGKNLASLAATDILLSTVPRTKAPTAIDFDRTFHEVPRAFVPRKHPTKKTSLSMSLILSSLRSFPSMMLSGRSFPPFIHPLYGHGTVKSDGKSVALNCRQGALQNCALLVDWCFSRTKENAVWPWMTIRLEQERLLAEYSTYSFGETLAALQAVSIYIILCTSENNEEARNCDLGLINTMIHLRLAEPSLYCVYLISFGISLRAPLTNATEACWQGLHYHLDSTKGHRKLTYGDLMNFQHGREGVLDPWLSQLDDFGTLVMAAAMVQNER
ncbi:Transcription factor gsfR2 [Hyphodiscus hymeniophilus]|uniref:Transcription factor gsfR2 n=1 Tax=Hyphodiscus hymeniophilus TaxID=353542 RepID=A0A9P6SMQ1_9HELO|nr:Transcription factor gsfR2 [Hyphodiscus hymeniophilus]